MAILVIVVASISLLAAIGATIFLGHEFIYGWKDSKEQEITDQDGRPIILYRPFVM